jgi:hypothetical protein
MKNFLARRRTNVLAQIPLRLTVTSSLPVENGYLAATNGTAALSGKANAILTRGVTVNGVPASWSARGASWSASQIGLNPGLNRLLVQAFDADGEEIDRSTVDVWQKTGSGTVIVAGNLAADAVWPAGDSPYLVKGQVTVPAGVSLTIEPGASVFFENGAGLQIAGRLQAQGAPGQRIRFTRPPGGTNTWAGLEFVNSPQTNVVAHADIECAEAGHAVIAVTNSVLLLDHVTVTATNAVALEVVRPRLAVRHSVFNRESAQTAIIVEDMAADGWLVLEGNLFGAAAGAGSAVRLNRASRKGGPVAQVHDNVFLGGEGYVLYCGETDAHIEGNLFLQTTGVSTNQAAVATGPGGAAGEANLETQRLILTRNVFWGHNYAVLARLGAYARVYNCVFAQNRGALLFDEPWRADSGPGRGAYVESCIFWNNLPDDDAEGTGAFVRVNNRAADGHSVLAVHHSVAPAAWHSYGVGNIEADPRFVRPIGQTGVSASLPCFGAGFEGFAASLPLVEAGFFPDARLRLESPSRGSGFNGVDMGAYVSSQASVSSLTGGGVFQTNLVLRVAGADIRAYEYRLIGPAFTNQWSVPRAEVKMVVFITCQGTTATASVPGHGYADGDVIEISGAARAAYEGTFPIFNVTADTFNFTVGGNPPDLLPPGDISCRKVEPIQLSGLSNGAYTIEVVRQNSLGVWQSEAEPTTFNWTVDTLAPGRVRLNEVLASNTGVLRVGADTPDVVELYNDGAQPAVLAGLSLTDDPNSPLKFVFPVGTILAPGEFLVLYADNNFTAPGWRLNFKLDQAGESIYLYDRQSNGGTLVDSVRFGLQLPNLSIGRLPNGAWTLNYPTPGGPNVAHPLGDSSAIRINEWLVAGASLYPDGFIELYNADPWPVAFGGLYLQPVTVAQPGLSALAPLSFIAGQSHAVLFPDGQSASGADHLDYHLPHGPGALGLFAADMAPIDLVVFGPQARGVSEGRSPTGGSQWAFFREPSPGYVNPESSSLNPNVTTLVFDLVTMTNWWSYNAEGNDLLTAWHEISYSLEAGWPAGQALFFSGSNDYPAPTNTFLSLSASDGKAIISYYFRTHFNVATNLSAAKLSISAVVDDGAVFYLNNEDLLRLNMPTNEILYATRPLSSVSTVRLDGPNLLRTNNLVLGDNVLAVEVHQRSDTSHDIAFGMTLTATLTLTNAVTNTPPAVVKLSEIHAHSVPSAQEPDLAADWIEIHNFSEQTADLGQMSLTDDAPLYDKWSFPTNLLLPPHGYLVVVCDPTRPVSSTNTSFGLRAGGGSVFLFAKRTNGVEKIDSITYGFQPAGFSIGRFSSEGAWQLTLPTPGRTNSPAALAATRAVCINEWMANPVSGDDWFELYNPGGLPVELSYCYLSDTTNNITQHRLGALSFLGTGLGAYQELRADADTTRADHVDFRLSGAGEVILLSDTNAVLIDLVRFGPQQEGVSEGRFPDGSSTITAFSGSPTPGAPNALSGLDLDSDHDGLPDQWERAYSLDPFGAADALSDSDHDGLTNIQEFVAGTDPRDALSVLALVVQVDPASGIRLQFEAVAGKSYLVQWREGLDLDSWRSLRLIGPLPVSGPIQLRDAPSQARTRFYRVVLILPP